MKYTYQEIFDRVYTHFILEGNPRCVNSRGHCVYRNADGAACAVGLFLTDDQAKLADSCLVPQVSDLYEEHPEIFWEAFGDDFAEEGGDLVFLAELQEAHDVKPLTLRTQKFHELAEFYDLTIPEPTT